LAGYHLAFLMAGLAAIGAAGLALLLRVQAPGKDAPAPMVH
jgi:hypothetical protein